MVDGAQSWIQMEGLNPDWRDRVVGLCLAIPQGLTCELVHVEFPVVFHDLHVTEVCRSLDTYHGLDLIPSLTPNLGITLSWEVLVYESFS